MSGDNRIERALQSTLFWGCVSTFIALVLAVIAASFHDFRWLLAIAAPFAWVAIWEFSRKFWPRDKRQVRVITGIVSVAVTASLFIMWLYLKPNEMLHSTSSSIDGQSDSDSNLATVSNDKQDRAFFYDIDFSNPIKVGSSAFELLFTFINRTNEIYRVKDLHIILVEIYEYDKFAKNEHSPCDIDLSQFIGMNAMQFAGPEPVYKVYLYSPDLMIIDGVTSVPRSFEVGALRSTGVTASFSISEPVDWMKTNSIILCSIVRYFGIDGKEFRISNNVMGLSIRPNTGEFSIGKDPGPFLLWPYLGTKSIQ